MRGVVYPTLNAGIRFQHRGGDKSSTLTAYYSCGVPNFDFRPFIMETEENETQQDNAR